MSKSLLYSVPVLAVVFVLLMVSLPAAAHHVHHEVTRGEALVVSLTYGDGSPLAFDRYDIIAEGDDKPFQSGTTDAGGRIVFLPDRISVWRVKVFSEDGHGADFTIEAGPAGEDAVEPEDGRSAEITAVPPESPPAEAAGQLMVEKPFVERFAGPVAGVGIIFGVFGLISLFFRRRR